MTHKSLFILNSDGDVTIGYAEMVSQVMVAEQGAKTLVEESRARRQQLQTSLEQEISAMHKSYLARAR